MNGKRKSSSTSGTPASKKVCQKYRNVFEQSYTQEWPCIGASPRGACYVRCSLCVVDISVKHGGRNDCRRHTVSAKHRAKVVLQTAQRCLPHVYRTRDTRDESEDEAGLPFNSRYLSRKYPWSLGLGSDTSEDEDADIKSEPEDIESESEDIKSEPESEPEDIKSEPEDIKSEIEDIKSEPQDITIQSEPESEPEDIKSEPASH